MINEEQQFRDAIDRFAAIISGHPLVIDGFLTQVSTHTASEEFQQAVEDYVDYRISIAIGKVTESLSRKLRDR